MTKCTERVGLQAARTLNIRDTDGDGLLLDQILVQTETAEQTVRDAAFYLAQLARCPEVAAQADPRDPRRTTWSRHDEPWFTLTKEDRRLVFTEPSDGSVSLQAKRFGLLSTLQPRLIRRELARGVAHPETIRTPEYWIDRYRATAHRPILDATAIAVYNRRESDRIVDVDAELTKGGPTRSVREILTEVLKYYGVESRDGDLVRAQCQLGVGGAVFTGTLANKGAQLTLDDWQQIVAAMRLPIDVVAAAPPDCPSSAGVLLNVRPGTPLERRIPTRYGIITQQTDLRLFPDPRACFASADSSADDLCTAHRPHLGEPVVIWWEGREWSFVKTTQAGGWVRNSHLASADRADIDRLLTARVAVRDFTTVIDDVRLGMGTRLPFVEEHVGTLDVEIPQRREDGHVAWHPLTLPSSVAAVRPAFTYASLVKALLDTAPQGVWLYANKAHKGTEGVDCSGLVRMALEVHGLIIGRTTGVHFLHAGLGVWQRPATLAPVSAPTPETVTATWRDNQRRASHARREILQVLRQWDRDMRHGIVRGPLLLVWSGHVSVFLGFDARQQPMVVSSLSRSKVLRTGVRPGPMAPTEDLWFLGPTVTPLDISSGVPGTQGRTLDWYARIETIREIR